MTQEEITIIVQQVLQALLTNGKTIAQLSAVQDVSDSDCFEISGGKKVLFSVLANAIIREVGNIENFNVVDYDGRDEVVTFTYTKSTGVITVKQSGRAAKTITIAAATTAAPGLMSAADKVNLSSAVNKMVSSFSAVPSSTKVTVSATFADGTSKTVDIPVATLSVAGVMSAADKNKLEVASTRAATLYSGLGAANGIATLDANGRLNEDQLPSGVLKQAAVIGKANLNEVGILSPDEWPKTILFNVGSEDTTGAQPGDVIFVRRHQGNVNIATLYYIDINGDSHSLGSPITGVIYYHKASGMPFRWDVDNMEFVPMGLSLDVTGHLSQSQAAPQVMMSMGADLDNVGNTGPHEITYVPSVGDIYFSPSQGKILYVLSQNETIEVGSPSKLLIYCNAQSNKLYRWSGTAMVQLG